MGHEHILDASIGIHLRLCQGRAGQANGTMRDLPSGHVRALVGLGMGPQLDAMVARELRHAGEIAFDDFFVDHGDRSDAIIGCGQSALEVHSRQGRARGFSTTLWYELNRSTGGSQHVSDEQLTQRKQAPQIPSDMKAFNRKVIEEHRANKGKLSGMMANRHVLLLTTIGRKTGQERTVVVGYGQEGDRYIVIASDNGAKDHPHWYRNLLANPTATVEVGADRIEARARTARPQEREQFIPLVPYIRSQQELTSREIPIVVLEAARRTS